MYVFQVTSLSNLQTLLILYPTIINCWNNICKYTGLTNQYATENTQKITQFDTAYLPWKTPTWKKPARCFFIIPREIYTENYSSKFSLTWLWKSANKDIHTLPSQMKNLCFFLCKFCPSAPAVQPSVWTVLTEQNPNDCMDPCNCTPYQKLNLPRKHHGIRTDCTESMHGSIPYGYVPVPCKICPCHWPLRKICLATISLFLFLWKITPFLLERIPLSRLPAWDPPDLKTSLSSGSLSCHHLRITPFSRARAF